MGNSASVGVDKSDLESVPDFKSVGTVKAEILGDWDMIWADRREKMSKQERKKLENTNLKNRWAFLVKYARDSARHFVDDAGIFSYDGNLEIAQALCSVAVIIYQTLPFPDGQDDEIIANLLDDIRNWDEEIRETTLEQDDSALELQVRNQNEQKCLEIFQNSVKLPSCVIKKVQKLNKEQKSHLYEYVLRLNAASISQVYADQAFEKQFYAVASLFYDFAGWFYGSSAFDQALDSSSTMDLLLSPRAQKSVQAKRRASAVVSGKGSVLNFKEREEMETKFTVLLRAKKFPAALEEKLSNLHLSQKKQICQFFESTFEGPIFQGVTEEEMHRRASQMRASNDIKRIRASVSYPIQPKDHQQNVILEDSPDVKHMIQALKKENAILPFGKDHKPPLAIRSSKAFQSQSAEDSPAQIQLPNAVSGKKVVVSGELDNEALMRRPTIQQKRRKPTHKRVQRKK